MGKGVGTHPEVMQAAQTVGLLKAAATRGKNVKGASGAIASLLTESDNLICSSWILRVRVAYRNMVIDGVDAKTLRAMENLMAKVEQACEKVLNQKEGKDIAVGGGASPETDAKPAKEKPIYPECPECDPLKRALDDATRAHELAQ